jgi:hypothetical protein
MVRAEAFANGRSRTGLVVTIKSGVLPFGTVIQAPDDRLDRAPLAFARPRAPYPYRRNGGFELGPLGVAQYWHCLSPVVAGQNRIYRRFAKS